MTGVREVKKHNSDQFVKDFNSIRSFVVVTKYNYFFEVKKHDVWRRAKEGEIAYELTDRFYVRKRISMILL